VRSIEVKEKKGSQFVIKYSDNTSYTYEAKSPEIAREIAQKVTGCMMIRNSLNTT